MFKGRLIFTHFFSTSVVLVLNEMVLVLESVLAIEQEHRHTTEHAHEHEHENTGKWQELLRNRTEMWVKTRSSALVFGYPYIPRNFRYPSQLQNAKARIGRNSWIKFSTAARRSNDG